MIRLRNERSVTTVFTCSLTLTDISMGFMGIPFSAIAMSQQRRWIFKDVSGIDKFVHVEIQHRQSVTNDSGKFYTRLNLGICTHLHGQ